MSATQSYSDPLAPTPNPARISDEARVAFWAEQASRLDWAQPWHTTHRFDKPQRIGTDDDGSPTYSVPEIAWFEGGKTDPNLQMLQFDLMDAEMWLADMDIAGLFKMIFGGEIDKQEAEDKHIETSM
mgnify:CR=1 FL=1